MYQISSLEICHKALATWSLAILQSLLSTPFGPFLGGWPLLQAHSTLPPQSLRSCCSLYLVCCSPNSSRGCSYSGGLPFSDTSREPFLDYPSKKHPLLFFLIENIIFSFRACIIICNYIHVCAYLVNLCLLHKD